MWVIRGLKKGVITTKFPEKVDEEEKEFLIGEVVVKKTLPFKKSIHVFFADAGSCNSCNREVEMLNNPYYDFHRLGIFFTPTPRHADVLLISGCCKEMVEPIKRAYEAIPSPKLVVAVGDCSEEFCDLCELKADAIVRGCPPSPYKILEALLKIAGKEVLI